MDQEKMGKFIAQCRKKLCLTQAQLAEKVGVTDKTVSKWEKGTNAPNISILNSLSEILNITTTELLNGEKRKNNSKSSNEQIVDIPDIVEYYVDINEKKIKIKMIIITIGLTLVFIIILISIALHNNYNNCFVYKLGTTDDGIQLNGILALTTEEDVLTISSVENITRYDLDEEKAYCYEYSLVSKDTDIYSYGNISECDYDESILLNSLLKSISIYITEKNNYNLLLNNTILKNDELSLRIRYINSEKKKKELLIPIKIYKIFSNDKISYEGGEKY